MTNNGIFLNKQIRYYNYTRTFSNTHASRNIFKVGQYRLYRMPAQKQVL